MSSSLKDCLLKYKDEEITIKDLILLSQRNYGRVIYLFELLDFLEDRNKK